MGYETSIGLGVAHFVKDTLRHGLEYFGLYYGNYRATVYDNADPEHRGRVKVILHELGRTQHEENMWFDPSMAGAGPQRGIVNPPSVGDAVYVCFDGGNPRNPKCFFGGWHDRSDPPEDTIPKKADADVPYKSGWITRTGHKLILDETPGKPVVKLVWHKPKSNDPALKLDLDSRALTAKPKEGSDAMISFSNAGVLTVASDGSMCSIGSDSQIVLASSNGTFMSIDQSGFHVVTADGVVISSSGPDITISCGGQLTINSPTVSIQSPEIHVGNNGVPLLDWLRSHVHPSSTGPTGVPVTAPTLV